MVEIDSGQYRKTPRHVRKGIQTRERLYRTALQLFEDRGFDETTVQQITDLADAGKGTFFHHFPTKDHVLAAYWDDFNRRILDEFDSIEESTVRDQLLKAMDVCGTAAKSESTMGRVLLSHFFTSPVLASSDRENEERLRAWFQRVIQGGIDRGEVRSGVDVDSFLHLVIANLSSTVTSFFVEGGEDPVELLKNRTQLLLHAIENPE